MVQVMEGRAAAKKVKSYKQSPSPSTLSLSVPLSYFICLMALITT